MLMAAGATRVGFDAVVVAVAEAEADALRPKTPKQPPPCRGCALPTSPLQPYTLYPLKMEKFVLLFSPSRSHFLSLPLSLTFAVSM